MITSGIRLGTPAATSRGFGPDEFCQTGQLIAQVLDGLAANPDDNSAVEAEVRQEVSALCRRFPIYPDL
jgi:glycine hydroxymethyltransferase